MPNGESDPRLEKARLVARSQAVMDQERHHADSDDDRDHDQRGQNFSCDVPVPWFHAVPHMCIERIPGMELLPPPRSRMNT